MTEPPAKRLYVIGALLDLSPLPLKARKKQRGSRKSTEHWLWQLEKKTSPEVLTLGFSLQNIFIYSGAVTVPLSNFEGNLQDFNISLRILRKRYAESTKILLASEELISLFDQSFTSAKNVKNFVKTRMLGSNESEPAADEDVIYELNFLLDLYNPFRGWSKKELERFNLGDKQAPRVILEVKMEEIARRTFDLIRKSSAKLVDSARDFRVVSKSPGMSQVEADFIDFQLEKMCKASNQAETEMKNDGGLLMDRN